MNEVLFEESPPLGIITLNRKEALNALNFRMIEDLYETLLKWKDAPQIEAVLVKSASEKAFSAGGDVRDIYQKREKREEQMLFFSTEYRLNALIYHYPKPYIPLLNGITMGGGVGISIHGSYPIAGEKFVFAMPETSIGLFPDIGSSYFLSRLPDEIGLFLGLTGKSVGPDMARSLGIVRYTIPFHRQKEMMAIFSHSQKNMDNILSKKLASLDEPLNVDSMLPAHFFKETDKEMVQEFFKAKTLSELITTLKNNKNMWCQDIFEILSKKSQLSLAITFTQIQKAKNLTFDECLKLDEKLVKYCMEGSDFYEGIRALLIDKDGNQNWECTSIEEAEKRISKLF